MSERPKGLLAKPITVKALLAMLTKECYYYHIGSLLSMLDLIGEKLLRYE